MGENLEEGAPSTHNTFVSAVVISKSNLGRKTTFYIILNLSWCFLSFPISESESGSRIKECYINVTLM